MQNIDLICVGKLNAPYFAAGVAEYQKRLAAFCRFRVSELPEAPLPDKNASPVQVEKALEKEGKAIVIRPPRPVEISRVEKDVRKLNALYQEGYNAAFAKADAIREFLGE